MKNSIIAGAWLALAAIALSACGGDGTSSSPSPSTGSPAAAPAATLVSISITPTAATAKVGATQQFMAVGVFSDKSTKTLNASVTWSSSHSNLASISNAGGTQGVATAIAAGATTISAASGKVSSSGATLTVAAMASTPVTGAPQVTTQPAAQTVVVGQHALFNVAASGATSYQWYKNGTAINGATSTVYYSPALQAGDAGASFTVIATNSAGSVTSNSAAVTINSAVDGSPPASFWGTATTIPPGTQAMTFNFINRTNGVYPDSQVFWSVQGHTAGGTPVNEVHSIADEPSYAMPALTSARMYFYIAPNTASINNGANSYYDFIEFNIGGTANDYNFNGDTTRVDAFGLKTAIRLVCGDGTDVSRGEDYGTFLEDRSITFLKYLAEVPAVFASTELPTAPFRIVNPGAADFGPAGANAGYFQAYIDEVWANNNIDTSIVPKPTPFLDFANGNITDLSAALMRHVADKAGTFTASGTLVNPNFWSTMPSSAFYQDGPANYYAQYWHSHGIGGFAYGFPYDDVGGHSSDIGCAKPSYLSVALGW